MDQVKALLADGSVTPADLLVLARCPTCGDDPPTFKQACKDQRSEEWIQARSGRLTASDAAAVCVSSASSKLCAKVNQINAFLLYSRKFYRTIGGSFI